MWLLTARDTLLLPPPVQAAYLLCVWTVAYQGAILVVQYAVAAVAVAASEDGAFGEPVAPAVIAADLVPKLAAMAVLRHVAVHLRPSQLRACSE